MVTAALRGVPGSSKSEQQRRGSREPRCDGRFSRRVDGFQRIGVSFFDTLLRGVRR